MNQIDISYFGAEELMYLYVVLCHELGIGADQAKAAALELIDMAMASGLETLH